MKNFNILKVGGLMATIFFCTNLQAETLLCSEKITSQSRATPRVGSIKVDLQPDGRATARYNGEVSYAKQDEGGSWNFKFTRASAAVWINTSTEKTGDKKSYVGVIIPETKGDMPLGTGVNCR